MYLISSNDKKIAEFRRFGLDLKIKKGIDLKEVKGTSEQVIVYKSLAAGKDTVVEDTILIIDGEEVVDIRWKIDQLTTAENCQWVVTLGHNDGEMIHIYRGIIDGKLVKPDQPITNAFGFDPFFVPNGSYRTLYDLEKIGKKDDFSARHIATKQLTLKQPTFSQRIKDIPAWTGDYQ